LDSGNSQIYQHATNFKRKQTGEVLGNAIQFFRLFYLAHDSRLSQSSLNLPPIEKRSKTDYAKKSRRLNTEPKNTMPPEKKETKNEIKATLRNENRPRVDDRLIDKIQKEVVQNWVDPENGNSSKIQIVKNIPQSNYDNKSVSPVRYC
jgi:hypothetical protein